MRVALLSGGKDSLYAAYLSRPIDLGLFLVYETPRPSPHLLNMGKSVETLLAAGIPVVVLGLSRGREKVETVEALRRLGVDEVVAGDVYVEDHLRYMESVAREAGASLREPLWGEEPEELTYRIFGSGFEALVIGAREGLGGWLGRVVDRGSVEGFVEDVKALGMDPLGERGEYHTLVISSPLHRRRIGHEVIRVEHYPGYVIARVV